MTFHYIAMPHLPVTKEYCACAFTQKIHKLTRMMLAKGHKVYLYGVGYTDIKHKNLEFIPVVSIEDVFKEWGDGDNRFELGYDHSVDGFRHDLNKPPTETTTKFRANAIAEIDKRKKDDHFLLLSQGYYHKPIADAVKLYLTCEPGIGYRGSYVYFRAFESTYIQNFTYGSEHPRESINGNWYHRVIPNYFDLNDFEFSDKKSGKLCFIGRLIERKGISVAMKVAEALGKELYIAGQGSLKDINYKYKKAIHVGTLGVEERKKFMKEAGVIFVPTTYLEPFGGVAIEANLSGTPVITTDFGSFPDIVENGINGYRCNMLRDFIENTKKAMKLDREKVRKYALKFSMENVNESFETWWRDLYQLYLSTKDKNVKGWHNH